MTRTTTRSHELFREAQERFPGGVNSPVRAFRAVDGEPFTVARGEGPYLFDVDGNRYVDYIMSWGPLVLGHAHPAVVEALGQQLHRGTSYGAPNEREVQLAQAVQDLMPNLEMLRFVNSGTEAAMSVIRLARGFTGRSKIIKFAGCYHGHVDTLLVQAGSGVMTLGLPDSKGVLPEVVQGTLTARFNDLQSVEALFEAHASDIAAVILEPVVGNAGFILPDQSFLEGLREITKDYGALLIFDEVMTGFRVHLGGAQTLYKIVPDLTMLGKVIGGGLPVGAFGGRADIMRLLAPLGPVYQAGTLSGNPLAMTAGLSTLKEWSKGNTFALAAQVTSKLVQEMTGLAKEYNIPFTAKSQGTMFGFFFTDRPVRSLDDAKTSNLPRFKKFFHLLLEKGVYFAPSQFEAGFTSSVHSGEALEHTITALSEAFEELGVA